MTVKELLEILNAAKNNGRENDAVVIEVSVEKIILGPTPSVTVKEAQMGFDWDSHKIILVPERKLSEKK